MTGPICRNEKENCIMKPKISAHTMANEFFLCFIEEDIKRSREIVDEILKLPKEDVATCFACLGMNFWYMYNIMRELDPKLAKMVRSKIENE